jgi:hypothetical protein
MTELRVVPEEIVSRSKAGTQTSILTNRVLLLVGGDLLVLLIFTWVGRRSHTLPLMDIRAFLMTAAPFMIGWFLIAPWFGLFNANVSQNWRKLAPRLLLAWIIGGPLALILRALLLGRPIPAGIPLSFAVAALTFSTLFMLAWRLGYIWWITHRSNRDSGTGSIEL